MRATSLQPYGALILLAVLLNSAVEARPVKNVATKYDRQDQIMQREIQAQWKRAITLSRVRGFAAAQNESSSNEPESLVLTRSVEELSTSTMSSSEPEGSSVSSSVEEATSTPVTSTSASSPSSSASVSSLASSTKSAVSSPVSSSPSSSFSESTEPSSSSSSASSSSSSSSVSSSSSSSASSSSASSASSSSPSISSSSSSSSSASSSQASSQESPSVHIPSSTSSTSLSSSGASTAVSSSSSSVSSSTAAAVNTSAAGNPTTSSSAAFSTKSPGKSLKSCSCGYSISNFGDLYLQNSYSIDFRKYSSVSALSSAGMFVANGYQIGNTAPDGTFVYADNTNVKFGKDGVHLLVPGNQPSGGKVTGAQLIFNNGGEGMTKMYAEAEIQVDATPGSVQAFWSFTNNLAETSDEQDMEVIAASLMTNSTVHEAGLQLANHAPDKSGNKDTQTIPFSSDPSAGFHKYTLAWSRDAVSYAFDGEVLAGPTEYVSQNPSNIVLSHWASGDVAFLGAPLPNSTVTMRVRSLKVYYETAFTSSLPSGCTQADVCVV